MNSCRNCRHSVHDSDWFRPALYCKQTKRTVAPPASKIEQENLKADAQLSTIAASCAAYQREI